MLSRYLPFFLLKSFDKIFLSLAHQCTGKLKTPDCSESLSRPITVCPALVLWGGLPGNVTTTHTHPLLSHQTIRPWPIEEQRLRDMSDVSVGAVDTAIEYGVCSTLLSNVFIPILVFAESNEDVKGQCLLLNVCVCLWKCMCLISSMGGKLMPDFSLCVLSAVCAWVLFYRISYHLLCAHTRTVNLIFISVSSLHWKHLLSLYNLDKSLLQQGKNVSGFCTILNWTRNALYITLQFLNNVIKFESRQQTGGKIQISVQRSRIKIFNEMYITAV